MAPSPPPLVAVAPPQEASAKPSTEMALPQALTGTCTTVEAWLPVSTPEFVPVVMVPPPALLAVAAGSVADSLGAAPAVAEAGRAAAVAGPFPGARAGGPARV